MFCCKVMAFAVAEFYIGVLEHFQKKSKSLREFYQKVEVWRHFFIDLLIQIIPNIFVSTITCS